MRIPLFLSTNHLSLIYINFIIYSFHFIFFYLHTVIINFIKNSFIILIF